MSSVDPRNRSSILFSYSIVTSKSSGTMLGQSVPYVTSIRLRAICSGRLSSDGSETIKNLQTGVTYEFWVVAFDEAENPSDVVSLGQATPGLTEDLWERYKRKGGAADGSYCTIDSSPTPLGLMLLPLAWLLLLSRRRRNRCRPAGRRLRPEQFGRLLRAEKRR